MFLDCTALWSAGAVVKCFINKVKNENNSIKTYSLIICFTQTKVTIWMSSQAAKKSWHNQKDSLLIWCGNSESRSEVLLNVMIFRELWLAEKKYTYAVSGLREASCFK